MKKVAGKPTRHYRRRMTRAKPESQLKTVPLKAMVSPIEKKSWDVFCSKKLKTNPSEGLRQACVKFMQDHGAEWGTIISVLVFGLMLTGCASTGRPINESKLAQIRRGETTQAQVVELLGKPTSVGVVDDSAGMRTVMTYQHSVAVARPETFLPVAGGLFGGAETTTRTVVFGIATNGVVESITSTTGSDSSGGAFATKLDWNNTKKKAAAGQRGGH